MTTSPEPANGHALYWAAAGTGEYPVVMVRDDKLSRDWTDDRQSRWFEANSGGEPMTYEELCEHSHREGYPLDEAVLLAPAPEMVGDHPRELGGYCRRCGEVHSEPEWQRIADRAAEGGQSGG